MLLEKKENIKGIITTRMQRVNKVVMMRVSTVSERSSPIRI
jgi:hypothetical protein